jgi:peptidoglycan hydrolase CwlO-like protein
MCNPHEEKKVIKTREELIDEALEKIIALKQDLDLNLSSLDNKELEKHDIEVQLQASMQESLQCIQALKFGYKSWSEVPLNTASI